jgi:hypothetical protein
MIFATNDSRQNNHMVYDNAYCYGCIESGEQN